MYSLFKRNNMTYSFLLVRAEDPKQEAHIPELVRDEEQLHNITDGGEFLDDAIRMKDQPLTDTGLSNYENFE